MSNTAPSRADPLVVFLLGNNGKGGYFRFDDDNNMIYRYILSITYTEMGQLNTYNPIYCNENKR